jgi:integrase
MRLTVKSIAEIQPPAGKADHVEWDDDIAGFGLRIRNGSKRTWVYRYRIGKKQRSITLGSTRSVPLATARANAGQLEAKVRLGGDPALEKETARAAAIDLTGALVDQYLDARQAEQHWRPASLREVSRYLLVYAKPLHGLPVTAISQREIAKLLNKIVDSSGIATSNRFRAALAAFLRWTIEQGIRLPDGNVASNIRPRKEQSRARVINEKELNAVWRGCRDDDHGTIIRLLMLTGQRAAEIGSLRWDEIRDDRIELPGSRTKNKHPHSVPLSAPAKAILDCRRILGRVHVFGRDDTHGFRGWGLSKRRLDERVAKAGAVLPHWTVHDLRRTAATGMINLGIQPHVVEAVLNHVGHKSGVAGIYNRATYDAEKRKALECWAQHVLKIAG